MAVATRPEYNWQQDPQPGMLLNGEPNAAYLPFVRSFKQDWCSSRDFADLLLHESRWSKAIYGYQKASFMCMMSERLEKDEREELIQLFKDIPKWKQRIAGKSIPMEKFIVKKCERFFAQGNKLVLPAIELIYLWNSFKILGKQVDLVQPLHSLVEKHIKLLEKDRDQIYFVDNIGLAYLLKGMCLKFLNCPTPAKDCFLKVISFEKEFTVDHYLVPYATYELGSILWSEGNQEQALITLENAKNNYKGYALESRLHFRVHSALAEIKTCLKKESSTTSLNSNISNSNHRKKAAKNLVS